MRYYLYFNPFDGTYSAVREDYAGIFISESCMNGVGVRYIDEGTQEYCLLRATALVLMSKAQTKNQELWSSAN